MNLLESEYQMKPFASGYYYSDKYMVMAHPYFRRGYHDNCNFAPRFIDVFWKFNKKDIQKHIAIDSDRVRINVDNTMYMEFDTWYGAKFQETIKDIDDGVVKLRPPLDLNSFEIEFFFGDTYALDIKWSSKMESRHFKQRNLRVKNVRYQEMGKIFPDQISTCGVRYE